MLFPFLIKRSQKNDLSQSEWWYRLPCHVLLHTQLKPWKFRFTPSMQQFQILKNIWDNYFTESIHTSVNGCTLIFKFSMLSGQFSFKYCLRFTVLNMTHNWSFIRICNFASCCRANFWMVEMYKGMIQNEFLEYSAIVTPQEHRKIFKK